MKRLLVLSIFLLASCSSCDKNGHTDNVKNKALEKTCSGKTILKMMAIDKQIGREYACGCIYAAKKSDANNCATIINVNNSRVILDACKGSLKGTSDCRLLFKERK